VINAKLLMIHNTLLRMECGIFFISIFFLLYLFFKLKMNENTGIAMIANMTCVSIVGNKIMKNYS